MGNVLEPPWGEPPKAAGAPSDYRPPLLIGPTVLPLRCAICLHKPPGDRDITQAAYAVTVMEGRAVCEEHVGWLTIGDSIEDALLDERERDGRNR